MNKKKVSSNSLETNFSGPIITLLRNKFDNYQRKKFKIYICLFCFILIIIIILNIPYVLI